MNSGVQRPKQVHSIQTALTSTKPLVSALQLSSRGVW
jgi:hypothetical protein